MPTADTTRPVLTTESWIASALLGNRPDISDLSKPDVAHIVEAADKHGVASLLHHLVSRNDDWDAFPSQLRKHLSRIAHQKAAWDLHRQTDLGQLLGLLAEAGVPYLVFKGGGLAYTHYEQSYLRDRCDTDILFADQPAFEQAWGLLKSMGFQRRNTLSGEFVGYQHCCWRPLGHEVQQVLDCHIRINDYVFYADALDFDELTDQSVPMPALAESSRSPGPVHALLIACMHLVATMPLGDAGRLIWLFDLFVLTSSLDTDDWHEFLQLAQARSLCGTSIHGLRAAQVYFPVLIPDDIFAELEHSAEKEPFKPGEQMKRWEYYYQVFKSVPGIRKKTRLLKEHFLPPADYLLEKYQTSNRLKLPFLYVHRVFAGLKRYF